MSGTVYSLVSGSGRLDTLSDRYRAYIGLEAEATAIRTYEPILVPGLLQTEEYAAAILAVFRETEHQAIAERLHARLKRQELLAADPPLSLHAILSEAALMVDVGGADVMDAQCEQLVRLARLTNVTLQVLPFAAGAYLVARGSFVIIGFEQDDQDVGYLETSAGDLLLKSPKEVDRLNSEFDRIRELSLSPSDSVRLIEEKKRPR